MMFPSLGRDLDHLIDSYNKNPIYPDLWKPRGKCKGIRHDDLGRPTSKSGRIALYLPTEEGFDGKPVGSLSPRAARSYFDYGTNHVFPPVKDLIRLGLFMRLDLIKTLALVLKNDWERYFAHGIKKWRANMGEALIDVLVDATPGEVAEARNSFNPDTAALFGVFEQQFRFASKACKRRSRSVAGEMAVEK